MAELISNSRTSPFPIGTISLQIMRYIGELFISVTQNQSKTLKPYTFLLLRSTLLSLTPNGIVR